MDIRIRRPRLAQRCLALLLSAAAILAGICTAACTTNPGDPTQTGTGTDTAEESNTSKEESTVKQTERETATGEPAGEARDVHVLDTDPAAGVTFSPLALGRVSPDGYLENQLRLLAEHMAADFEDMSPDCKSDRKSVV